MIDSLLVLIQQMIPPYVSWEWVVGVLVVLVGYLMNKKLNTIENNQVETASRLTQIEIKLSGFDELKEREKEYQKEMTKFNRLITEISVKISLISNFKDFEK